MPFASTESAERKPEAKSRIGNGRELFLALDGGTIDGRTLHARVFRDTLSEIVSDLGGRESISAGEYQLCRRAAALAVSCLHEESKMAAGEGLNLEQFVPATNALIRSLQAIGLKRRARDVTPSLSEYVQAKTGSAQP